MIDPDLQKQLETINTNLVAIKKGQGIWRSFFNGMFGALGYLIGLALVVAIVGWYLNKTGLFPQLQAQIKDFQSIIQGAKNLMNPGQSQAQQGSATKGSYQVTLPNGQVVNVTP